MMLLRCAELPCRHARGGAVGPVSLARPALGGGVGDSGGVLEETLEQEIIVAPARCAIDGLCCPDLRLQPADPEDLGRACVNQEFELTPAIDRAIERQQPATRSAASKSEKAAMLSSFCSAAVLGIKYRLVDERQRGGVASATFRLNASLTTLTLNVGTGFHTVPLHTVEDIFAVDVDGETHFPDAALQALSPEQRPTLMRVVYRVPGQPIMESFCLLAQSKEARETFHVCIGILCNHARRVAAHSGDHVITGDLAERKRPLVRNL